MTTESLTHSVRIKHCCTYPLYVIATIFTLVLVAIVFVMFLVLNGPSVPNAGNPAAIYVLFFGPALLSGYFTLVVIAIALTYGMTRLIARVEWRYRITAFLTCVFLHLLMFALASWLFTRPFSH